MNRRRFLTYTAALVPMLLVNPWRTLQAWARPKVQLPLDRATLAWDWQQASGTMVETFEITGGGVRTLITDPSARSIRIKDLVPGTGIYRGLTVIAKNGHGATPATRPLPPIHVNTELNVVTLLG